MPKYYDFMICGYYLYFLIWHKDTTALGQRYRLGGSSSQYLRFQETVSEVQGDCFLMIPTRLDSSAEPSQQLCRLQSAALLSLAATPHYRTTTHSLVVRLYTLQLYNYIPFSCTTINLLLYKYKLIDSTIVVLQLKHFPKNPCIFQKKSVTLQKISCVRQFVSKLTLRPQA